MQATSIGRMAQSGPRAIIMNAIADVHSGSSAQTKIALFRSLFRWREDVYPRRFESLRTGKSGYAPACANEWRPGVCEKPRIRCAVCPNRQFLPVTGDVLRRHLTGAGDAGESFTMGVYRRDRRKDALLQEHGYLVLRFLAEDLGTRLDAVLDGVLRAFARRTGRRMAGSAS